MKSLSSKVCQFASQLCLLFFWVGFAALWIRVFQQTRARALEESLTLLVAIMAVYAALLTAWVLHNLSIYKRKGPRRMVRKLSAAPPKETWVDPRVDLLFQAEIAMAIVGSQKTYLPSSGARTMPAALSRTSSAFEAAPSGRS